MREGSPKGTRLNIGHFAFNQRSSATSDLSQLPDHKNFRGPGKFPPLQEESARLCADPNSRFGGSERYLDRARHRCGRLTELYSEGRDLGELTKRQSAPMASEHARFLAAVFRTGCFGAFRRYTTEGVAPFDQPSKRSRVTQLPASVGISWRHFLVWNVFSPQP
jgi:hypothetical protein